MSESQSLVDIGDIVAAITAASNDISDLSARVSTLEEINRRAEEENDRLRAQLSAVLPRMETAKGDLRAATSLANEAEARAAAHLGRADQLHADLTRAYDDLSMIELAMRKLIDHG